MREIFDRVEEFGIVKIEVETEADEQKKLYPWLFSIFIKVDIEDESSEGFENFLETKESLIIALEHQKKALYAGMRVVEGWSELYFYAKEAKNLDSVVLSMLRDNYYKYETSVVKDAKWDFYHKNLSPSELEFCNIESSKIIFLLQEEGDNLLAQREVEHYLSFDTSTQKDRFLEKALDCGYKFKDEISSEEFEHGVAISREHSVDQASVDSVVKELYELAKKEHGYYEGWSTVLVSSVDYEENI